MIKLNSKNILLLLFFTLALLSCNSDSSDVTPTENYLTVEKAKAWYKSNLGLKNLTDQMKSRKSDSTWVNLEPLINWDIAELDNDSVWSVVELPWEYDNGIEQVMNSEVNAYVAMHGDSSVIKQVIRLVILQNKKTGKMYGFKMIVVPDLQYMLEKADALEQNKYLQRDPDLSGTILFYSVKDEFINGWKYVAGNITAKVGIDKPNAIKQNTESNKVASDWEYNTTTVTKCYYHYTISGGVKSELILDGCTVEVLSFYSTDGDGGGGGGVDTNNGNLNGDSGGSPGSSGGDSDTNNNTAKILPRTDCPESALINANLIDNILKNFNTDYEKVSVNVDLLRSYATLLPSEHALVVNFADGQYYTLKQNDGSYITTTINTNQVNFSKTEYAVLICHTHPSGTIASPSPSDAIAIGNAYKDGAANITANVIFAKNGSEYMICVSNRSTFESFCNNASNAPFFERDESNFKPGTEWANQYNAVYNALMNQGYTQEEANSYALTHVLDTYNTGMKISMRSSKYSSFKEQKTDFINNKYQPTKCE